MKRKLSVALIAAIVGVLLCAAALAAVAYRAGMLDFISQLSGKENAIPKDALTYVQTDVAVAHEQGFTVSVREAYYDGTTLRTTVDVTTDDPKALPVGFDTMFEETLWNLTRKTEDENRTVLDFWREGGYEKAYSVEAGPDYDDDVEGGSGDYLLNEDGSLTLYAETNYTSYQATRNIALSAWITPYVNPAQDPEALDHDRMVQITCTFPVTAATREDSATAAAYTSSAPMDYPLAGVRVDSVVLTVTPLEIGYTISYTVTDKEAFARMENGLWFEFVDPDSTEPNPNGQRLQEGLQGSESVRPLDGDFDTAVNWRQSGSLSLSELHDSYTLRAYECWEKQRFDACTFAVQPLTTEESEALQGSEESPTPEDGDA